VHGVKVSLLGSVGFVLNAQLVIILKKSIVNAPPDYNFGQLFKFNLTFCLFLICNLKNQSFKISCLNLTSLFALFMFLICSLKNQYF
jgi:hypothetical protein